MSKKELRDLVIYKIPLQRVDLDGLTDTEMAEIIKKINADFEAESNERDISSIHLFGYVLLKYAMQLYKYENFEKGKQKAEENKSESGDKGATDADFSEKK